MERIKGENQLEEKGDRGNAVITKLSDTHIRVNFENNKEFNIQADEEGKLPVPDAFPIKKIKKDGTLRANLTLNKDGNKILFASPQNGDFSAKFEKIVAKKDAEPAPTTYQGKYGPFQMFGVLLKITEGNWKGTSVYHGLSYRFGEDEAGNLAIAGDGDWANALYDFLNAVGVTDHDIPFSENGLPEINKIALEEDRDIRIIMSKGKIDMITPAISEDDFEEEADTESEKIHPALVDEVTPETKDEQA
jgi:hypothetical protein